MSLARLRRYEVECSWEIQSGSSSEIQSELIKFTQTLRGAVRDLESMLDARESSSRMER